ncbi:hypothetical protein BDZ89DRAFT_1050876 [Hymenopellis radicata]|nr:hypothetical protein BDZ89DRAFT_1050876 [Hymenopellis radicata]
MPLTRTISGSAKFHPTSSNTSSPDDAYLSLDLGTSAHPGALALAGRVTRGSKLDTRTRLPPGCGTRVRHPFAAPPTHGQLMPHLHPPAIARGAAAVHDADTDGLGEVELDPTEQFQRQDIKNFICITRVIPYKELIFNYTYQPATSPADDVAAHIHRPRSSSTLFSVAGGVSSFEYADTDSKSSVNTVTGVLLPRLRGLTRPAGYPWRRLKVVLHKHGCRLKVVRRRHYRRGSGNALAEVVVVVCLHGCLGTGTRSPNTRTRVSTRADTLPGTGKHSTPGCLPVALPFSLEMSTSAHPSALALAAQVTRGSEVDTRTRATPEYSTRVWHPFASVSHTRVCRHSSRVAGVHGYTHPYSWIASIPGQWHGDTQLSMRLGGGCDTDSGLVVGRCGGGGRRRGRGRPTRPSLPTVRLLLISSRSLSLVARRSLSNKK